MRTKKALLNLVFSLLLQFVTAISGFIQPLLFINTYGSNINGLVSSIKNIISYLNLVEAGVATAASQALYKPIADKNISRINNILSATKIFYLKSGNLFALMTIILASVYPFIIDDEISKLQVFVMVIIIGSTGVSEYYLIGKYRVLITADQKSYIISIVQTLSIIVTTVLSILLMIAEINVTIVLIATSVISISRIILLYLYIKKYYPNINFKSEPDMLAISKKWDAFIHQISNMIVFNSPILIITLFCTLGDVSVYAVYLMVFTVITSIVTAFSNGLVAGFGEVLVDNQTSIIKDSFRLFECVYYSVTVCMYSVTALMILPFIELYTKGINDANYSQPVVAYLFVFVFLINNLRVPALTIIYAAGHFKETRKSTIIEASVGLVISLVCVQVWDIKGVLIGSFCAAIYRLFDILFYCNNKIINRRVNVSFKIILLNISLGIVIYSLFSLIPLPNPVSWLKWIENASIISASSICIILLGNYLFDKTTVIEIKNKMRMVLKKL